MSCLSFSYLFSHSVTAVFTLSGFFCVSVPEIANTSFTVAFGTADRILLCVPALPEPACVQKGMIVFFIPPVLFDYLIADFAQLST